MAAPRIEQNNAGPMRHEYAHTTISGNNEPPLWHCSRATQDYKSPSDTDVLFCITWTTQRTWMATRANLSCRIVGEAMAEQDCGLRL